jgi:hypothetical protein
MIVACILTALIVAVGFFTSRTTVAAPTLTNPHIVSKHILDEMSIDGPALYESHGTPFDLIAWTGTDPGHRLNIMYSHTDFVSDRSKRILKETSFARPAIVVHDFGPPNLVVSIAWVGTDRQHTLNVLYDALGTLGAPKKLTLWGINSFAAPSLAMVPSQANTLILAWTATDTNHTLNIMPITIGATLKAGAKTTFSNFHSATGPSLLVDWATSGLLLSWSTFEMHRIAFAISSDGKRFSAPSTSPLAEWTVSPSSMFGVRIGGSSPEPVVFPGHFVTWAGTDAHHSLNVRYTTTFPQWGNKATSKTVFGEWCLGGPAIDYGIGAYVVVAWTGTDAAHHINLARIEV